MAGVAAGGIWNRPTGMTPQPAQQGPAQSSFPQDMPPPPPPAPQVSTNTVGPSPAPPPQQASTTTAGYPGGGPDESGIERDRMGNIVKVNGAAPTQAYWDNLGRQAQAKAFGFDNWDAFQTEEAKKAAAQPPAATAPGPVQPPPAPAPTSAMSALGSIAMPETAAGWSGGAQAGALSVGLGQRQAPQQSGAMSALRGKLY